MSIAKSESDFRAAITESKPGDTIKIAAGDYHMEMAPRSIYDIQIPHSLNIVSVGGIAHFYADLVKNGKRKKVSKGIFHLKPTAKDVTIQGIGFHMAHASSWNGAGIRAFAGNITVKGCVFSRCDMGILCMQKDVADRGKVKIEGSQFISCGVEQTHAHAMYVLSNEFLVRNCMVSGTLVGHHVKSLAAKTVVEGCMLDDGAGTSSYAVDISAGGDAMIRSNRVTQGKNGENPKIFSYMARRFGGKPGNVSIIGNTIINLQENRAACWVLKNETPSKVAFMQNQLFGFLPDRLFQGPVTAKGNWLEGNLLPERY